MWAFRPFLSVFLSLAVIATTAGAPMAEVASFEHVEHAETQEWTAHETGRQLAQPVLVVPPTSEQRLPTLQLAFQAQAICTSPLHILHCALLI